MVPKWARYVSFYKCFIDDVIGVWLCDPCPVKNDEMWQAFKQDMQSWHGLEWEISEPSTSINFMDLTISIEGDRLSTTLFEKAQNLYLYIPPHSAHPHGVATGLIFGQVLRVRRLCSKKADADSKIRQFQRRLLERGYLLKDLRPLFIRAEENASQYLARSESEHLAVRQRKRSDSQNRIYLHLQFHPEDPPSSQLQQLWKECILSPNGEPPVYEMENWDGDKVELRQMIVAYSRPLNLRNRFSVRDISGRGSDVSQYLA